MTGLRNVSGREAARVALAAALALAPAVAAAQDNQFDLRNRPTPTPSTPPVTGPVDPDNPAARPRPQPTEAPPPLVLPSTAPSAAVPTAAPSAGVASSQPRPVARRTGEPVAERPSPANSATPVAQASTAPAASLPPTVDPQSASAPFTPRNLDTVKQGLSFGLWAVVAALGLFVLLAGWLAWTRYFRERVRALPVPEIERPQLAEPNPAPVADNDAHDNLPVAAAAAPAPIRVAATGLEIELQATRMAATLMNTTLSYRLTVSNTGKQLLRDVRVEGDMISAHASRPQEPLFGARAPVLPELHRIATLAPGETVTLGGDIRLPLVAITPIRRGAAALFVPLARLRARGLAPTGISVEGGGTFLVGQEPGANAKLQPFRLDLGPRNYSNLGQHLLPAA